MDRLLQPDLLGLLVPMLIIGTGIGLVAAGAWRLGQYVVAAGVGVAAIARLLLPAQLSGLLRVRGRVFDTVALLTIAIGIAVITFTTADPGLR